MFFTSSRLSEKEKVLIELNKRAEIHFSEMKKANDEIKKNESIFDKNDRLRECTFEQIQRVLDGKSIQLSFCERKIEQEDAEDSDVQESNDFSFFWIPQASADWDDITYKGLKKNSKKVPPFKLYSQLKDECIRQEVKNPKHCIKV